MSSSYIPTRDVDLSPWADNFSALITADPTRYGLVAGDAVAIAALVATWDAAYTTATNPATRTPATVAAKDSAKGAMIPVLRLYAQQIKANTGVSNEDKVSLGIHINDAGPTPVAPPSTFPIVSVVSQFHLSCTLKWSDSATPTTKAKPPGSVGGLCFTTIDNVVATDPEQARFRELNTKAPFDLAFDAADVGKKCTLWVRWTNRKGELGPWSAATSFTIA